MILVLNAGSSSLKLAVFAPDLAPRVTGQITNIGGAGTLSLGSDRRDVQAADHAAAVTLLLDALAGTGLPLAGFSAAAHRVVHGGTTLTAPARITPETLAQIRACIPLAPLHNPANLAAITALQTLAPDLPQTASFDTAFHATNPDLATRYAIPQDRHDAGLRRYGFHGLSYASLVQNWPGPLPTRLLAFHLGNGASLCAIRQGRSVATSMGFSPVSGLTMGTRAGDIDASAVLRLAADLGIAEADALLNRASGLLALAGDHDMRALLARTDPPARLAVAHFCYWAARHAGSAIVAMGGVDAIAFTGGIGENAGPVRRQILEHLSFLGPVPAHVIPAAEERQIARDALALLGAAP